ncbi:MAG TPA: DUF1493 family protein [Caulobacteraceae bacterium]|jgi:hypothetical protein
MVPNPTNALDDIVDLLKHISSPGRRPITKATELYYDLGLAGDDLHEAIVAIHEKFGTDFSAMNLMDYAPGETEALFSFDPLREFLGRPRRYRSLTVQLLLDAVDAGTWEVA